MNGTITATAESVAQARELVLAGVDVLMIGESAFGLRLPYSFTREEMREVVAFAHKAGARVRVPVNALLHTEEMKQVSAYLRFLEEIAVDSIVVADVGVVFLLQEEQLNLPYIYESSAFLTNEGQVNFWAKRGAIEAVFARELPEAELAAMQVKCLIPTEILVYGATVIQHSKRKLLRNYFQFIGAEAERNRESGWLLAEPQDSQSHYSIFEDVHGTHVFANNDLNLLVELEKLARWGYSHWKLDGLYTPGESFVEIAKVFVEAKKLLETGSWDVAKATLLDERIRQLHPKGRGLDTGFFRRSPEEIQ